MEIVVLRVWLPDRPGALGQVASRVGAVRGDVVGIDILERDAGQVIDELTIELPRRDLLDLLVSEVTQVDGVRVEEARWAPARVHDPRLDALAAAVALVEAPSPAAALGLLCERVVDDFDAEWVAVLEPVEPALLASRGEVPALAWLAAFVEGAGCSPGEHGHDRQSDVALLDIGSTEHALVVGRSNRPLRARERRQLEALARIAGGRGR